MATEKPENLLAGNWLFGFHKVMKSPRPNAVKAAIACIIASYVVSAVQEFKYLNLADRNMVIQLVVVSLAECAIVFGIYVRKNWVRWLFVATIAIWLVSLTVDRFNGHYFRGVPLMLLALNLTLSMVSVILLFYPKSNNWFRKRPTPAAVGPLINS